MHYLSFTAFFIFSLFASAQKHISTTVTINASPEIVWSILTDFEAYEDWNPFLQQASGTLVEGEKLHVNADGMKFSPKILRVLEYQTLKWEGKFLVKGLFDGVHSFELIANDQGGTNFVQQETFSGILVHFFKKKIEVDTKQGFEAMNQKLKALAEQQALLETS